MLADLRVCPPVGHMVQEESFELGDTVMVHGMTGDSDLNGAVGKLVKTVGRGRFAVMLEGKDKSTVVSVKNLERYVETNETPKPYDIVGTWDDWEPHPMAWNSGLKCYEFTVTLGNDGVESFKFLVEGDWDTCVYPNRKDAGLHDGHNVCGPADGGLDAEWTIGLHQTDRAAPGSSYKVRVFFSGGAPRSVKWENLQQESNVQTPVKEMIPKGQTEDDEPVKAYEPSRRVSWKDQIKKSEPVAKEKPYYRDENVMESSYRQAVEVEDNYPPRGSFTQAWSRVDERLAGSNVEEVEKAARERLAKRLELAAEAEMKMITDGDDRGSLEPSEKEKAALENKLKDNKKRYIAHSGARVDRETLYSGESIESSTEPTEAQTAKTAEITRLQGECIECRNMTENVLDVGGYCCPVCWQLYQAIMEEGWDSCVLIEGKQAAQHAQWIVDKKGRGYSISMARRDVMNKYPAAFRKDGSYKPYQFVVRQCSECGRPAVDGVTGSGDLWFCKACRRQ